jgi:hypothetical protein
MPMTSKLLFLALFVLSFTSSAVGWEPSSNGIAENPLVHYWGVRDGEFNPLRTNLKRPRGLSASTIPTLVGGSARGGGG